MVHVFCHLEETGDGLPPMCDMTFGIVDSAYDKSSSCWRLDLRADADPYDSVGFGAIIPVSGWREQIDGEGEDAFHSFWGSITLFSRGAESDRLLALLADYYSVPPPPPTNRGPLRNILGRKDRDLEKAWKFASRIECFAVGINSNPALVADDVIRMKLFLDEGVENGRYGEVFFNVDMPEGFAALNEKDAEYRTDLVHWLSVPGNVIANPYAGQH